MPASSPQNHSFRPDAQQEEQSLVPPKPIRILEVPVCEGNGGLFFVDGQSDKGRSIVARMEKESGGKLEFRAGIKRAVLVDEGGTSRVEVKNLALVYTKVEGVSSVEIRGFDEVLAPEAPLVEGMKATVVDVPTKETITNAAQPVKAAVSNQSEFALFLRKSSVTAKEENALRAVAKADAKCGGRALLAWVQSNLDSKFPELKGLPTFSGFVEYALKEETLISGHIKTGVACFVRDHCLVELKKCSSLGASVRGIFSKSADTENLRSLGPYLRRFSKIRWDFFIADKHK